MKKKLIGALLVAAMTVTTLAGCGGTKDNTPAAGSDAGEKTDSSTEATSDEGTADGDETLTVWCWDPTFNVYAMQQAEAMYQKDHPNFKLDIQEKVYTDIEQSLITAAEAGNYDTLPDIFLMQDNTFSKNATNYPELFTDLTDSGIDFDQFTGGKLADSTVDGAHYGIPFDNGATIMAIRSDMVEKAGLTVEDFKDTTWSEFMELAQKVVDANGVPMLTSSGGSEIVIEMLQSAGASPMVDGKVNLVDNAALKAAINVYKELIETGIMIDYTDWDQYIASMNKGTAAGVIQGCWIMSSIQAAEDQAGKWAIVNMPKLDDVEGATNYANCGGASWAVSSNCKNTDLAFDFLNATFGADVDLYDDLLVNAGAIVLKFWMQIDKDEQLRRFNDRQNDPNKQWKITDEDWRNRDKWDAYEAAVNEMLVRTDTSYAPWTVVEGNNKYYARLKVLKTVIDLFERKLAEKQQ